MNVIMMHSVGNNNGFNYPELSLSVSHFEAFCRYLKRTNYSTLLLEDWYELSGNTLSKNKKIVVLTFDDGYLDNWVFVYPILKKYGLKGTIFINPEFVDPGKNLRASLEDVWEGKMKLGDLQTLGFLNWNEIIEMSGSGVIDIQSHSMSHNFYFCSDKMLDIYHGQSDYDWLSWYMKPERKPYYLTSDNSAIIPNGHPVFEFGRALGLRRYFPDEHLIEFAEKHALVSANQEQKEEMIALLNQKLQRWPGRYETDEEMEARYRYELFNSKRILEEKLNKPVDFLCWPGGGYNELSIRLSVEAGYKASTLASREKYKIVDNSGFYKRIPRFGMGSFLLINGKRTLIKYPNYLIHSMKAQSGSTFYLNLNRFRKLILLMRARFR